MTLPQVHFAVTVLLDALPLSSSDLAERIEQAAEQLRYWQRRNQAARRSHDKTRRAEFSNRGIPLAELPRCEPR